MKRKSPLDFNGLVQGRNHHLLETQIVAQPGGEFRRPCPGYQTPTTKVRSGGGWKARATPGDPADRHDCHKAVQRHHFSFQGVFLPIDPDHRSPFHQAAAQGVGAANVIRTVLRESSDSFFKWCWTRPAWLMPEVLDHAGAFLGVKRLGLGHVADVPHSPKPKYIGGRVLGADRFGFRRRNMPCAHGKYR